MGRKILIGAAFLAATVAVSLAGEMKKLHTFDGDASGDKFGFRVDGAGDVNNDGHDDVIVSTNHAEYVRVHSGEDGTTLYTFTATSGDWFGNSVSGAGDVDNDGYDDVIVGAPGANYADVYSGKDGKKLHTFTGTGKFGNSVSEAGDVNKDGYADVIVGAWEELVGGAEGGTARVYSGKDGTVLHTFSRLHATAGGFGRSVSGAGDVNKDGYDDLIVGDYAADLPGPELSRGHAVVFSGKDGTILHTFWGDSGGDFFGDSVSGAGDVDADGYDDVAVGTQTGRYARVFSGKDGTTLYTFDGGRGVHGPAGDLDADGYDDLLVKGGWVRVFSGKDGTTLWEYPESLEGKPGWPSGAGDVNGDGWVDIIVGQGSFDDGTGRATVYGAPAPSGTITIDAGAEATSSTSVTLALTWKKAEAEVTNVRLRNTGDSWGSWVPVAATKSWTLIPGEGTKTVEAQFRDADDETSAVATDSIVLDQTPPTGILEIEHGAAWTATTFVTLALEYTDLQTRVTHVRLRNEGGAWSTHDAALEISWQLPAGGGEKTVEAEFIDAAGNVSGLAVDTIELRPDATPPSVDSILISGSDRLYLLPEEQFTIEVVARDNIGGAGIDAFKASFDEGSNWSEWYPAIGQGGFLYAEVERPEKEGLLTVTVVARDRARNESAPVSDTLYFVESAPPWLGSAAKGSGKVDGAEDVDAFELGLLGGDVLTVKLKAKALVRKGSFVPALDLCRPDGESLLKGRYPDDAKKVSIVSFTVPETGRYILIVRKDFESEEDRGTYKLSAKVKQAKANKKGAGEWTGTEIPFDAVHGSTFKAKLVGEGIVPESVTLVGPEGEVAIETKGKAGKVSIKPVALDAGTGTYVIRLASEATVSCRWSLKLPKIKGTVGE